MLWTGILVFKTVIPSVDENEATSALDRRNAAQTNLATQQSDTRYRGRGDTRDWTEMHQSYNVGINYEESTGAINNRADAERTTVPFLAATSSRVPGDLELERKVSTQPNISNDHEARRTCKLRTRSELELRRQMGEFAKAWRDRRLRVYVQHMNKAGGTTLCEFFKTSAFRVPEEKNCNGGAELSKILSKGSLQVQGLLSEGAYDIYFNENPMHAGELAPSVAYITSIRRPEERIVSQMLHHWERFLKFDGNGALVNLSEVLDRYLAEDWVEGTKSIYLSNMQTRHLAGLGTENVDMENIYIKAVERLENFLFTIPTDRMGEGLENLEFFLGRRVCSPSCTRIRQNTHGAESQLRLLVQTNATLYKKLLDENFYDTCLYLQAQVFHIEQSSVLNMFRRFNAT